MNESPEQPSQDRITRAVFEHAARISRERNIEELIRLNADFARDLVAADRCSLWLIDSGTGHLWTKIAHGIEPIRIPLGDGLVSECIQDDKVLIINNADEQPRFLRRVDQASGYMTEQILCVPMRADGRVIGALQLLNKPGGFTEADAGLLGLLAHFAASAIESERLRQEALSAQLLRHEVNLARDVQSRLLPVAPNCVPGVQCAGFCRPTLAIGGDYYDLIPAPNGSFAVTLGDVSGKGIPAAVMMASIQTLLRSMLHRDAHQLPALFRDLNRALYASSTADRYSTLFCGVLSADRSQLTYVNAGQVPPFLVRKNGELVRLSSTGVPVGLLPQCEYEQEVVAMQPGDTLVIVSDGIIEVFNAQEDLWDEAIVEDVIIANRAAPATAFAEALCRRADEWAGGASQFDDMTVVVVRLVS